MPGTLTPELFDVTEALITNLLASETFTRYRQAHNHLNEDFHARALLQQLARFQDQLRRKTDAISREDTECLRAMLTEVQNNAVIKAYFLAQQEAVGFIREVNTEISQLLGINFATFANRSTC